MDQKHERRLLDLLAGWASYLQACVDSSEPHPGVTKEQYERELEQVSDLYQEVAKLPKGTDAWDFIRSRILPIIVDCDRPPWEGGGQIVSRKLD